MVCDFAVEATCMSLRVPEKAEPNLDIEKPNVKIVCDKGLPSSQLWEATNSSRAGIPSEEFETI